MGFGSGLPLLEQLPPAIAVALGERLDDRHRVDVEPLELLHLLDGAGLLGLGFGRTLTLTPTPTLSLSLSLTLALSLHLSLSLSLSLSLTSTWDCMCGCILRFCRETSVAEALPWLASWKGVRSSALLTSRSSCCLCSVLLPSTRRLGGSALGGSGESMSSCRERGCVRRSGGHATIQVYSRVRHARLRPRTCGVALWC